MLFCNCGGDFIRSTCEDIDDLIENNDGGFLLN